MIPYAQVYTLLAFFQNMVTIYIALFSVLAKERLVMKVSVITHLIGSILAVFGFMWFDFMGILISKILTFMVWVVLFWYILNYTEKIFQISLLKIVGIFFLLLGILGVSFLVYSWLAPTDLVLWLNSILNKFGETVLNRHFEPQISLLVECGITAVFFLVMFTGCLIGLRLLTKDDLRVLENLNLRFPGKKQLFWILDRILLSSGVIVTGKQIGRAHV